MTAVGASTNLPLTGSIDRWGITIEGRPLANPEEAPEADRYGVEADYFAAMQIPLLRGRLFTAADGPGAPPVVVIGKTMADRLWPGEEPIGRRITLAGGPNNPPRTIVGIVGDVRHNGPAPAGVVPGLHAAIAIAVAAIEHDDADQGAATARIRRRWPRRRASGCARSIRNSRSSACDPTTSIIVDADGDAPLHARAAGGVRGHGAAAGDRRSLWRAELSW